MPSMVFAADVHCRRKLFPPEVDAQMLPWRLTGQVQIKLSRLGTDASLLGAAYLALSGRKRMQSSIISWQSSIL